MAAIAERAISLAQEGARVGLVLPSAFHANQSATGIRELWLEKNALRCCFSFENAKKLFDIHSSFKFATVVVERTEAATRDFQCAFYLHDLEWLFDDSPSLPYTLDFVRKTGGEYLSLLELRSPSDADVATRCFGTGEMMSAVAATGHIRLGRELNMTDDAFRFTPGTAVSVGREDARAPVVHRRLLERGYLPLHEGKTFHQYDDRWEDPPRYLVALSKVADKANWLSAARYYRLAFRDIARATDERTGIFCLLPPGVLCGNKAPVEREPAKRPTSASLLLLATANTFAFDFLLRLRVQATVNLFILEGIPVPKRLAAPTQRALAHSALRLSANHEGYRALWKEQLGTEWREGSRSPTWPVLADPTSRWKVRAAVDALVANGYGLTRSQYEHVLSSFPHTSFPDAPSLCLAAFDELARVGVDAFARATDPYLDVPLNEKLPQPQLDFPQLQPWADAAPLPLLMAAEGDAPRRPSPPAGPKSPRRAKKRTS